MRILLVNKFHWNKGGSEKYYFELGQLLKEHENEVAYFSMNNEKNITTGDKEYFVDEIDLNTGSKLKALDVIYSKANYKKMLEAIDDFKPDLIHVNNFQRQLSSSIIKAANDKKIPIVFTAHDVQAICPAITMLDNDKNNCELCLGGHYINCVKKSCNKGSKAKSLIGAIEGYYYRLKKIYTDKINYIITPSEFYRKKFIEDGFNPNNVEAIHNFIMSSDYDVDTEIGDYALYYGRLSKEKGINNLIMAFSKCKNGKLYIAGDGPEREKIEKFIIKNKLSKKVKLLGFLDKENIIDYVRKSRFIVVPSIWYENCPYSVMESLAIGKPVIGANIAGIPELIVNNENGYTYEYNNIDELTDKMNLLFENDELVKKFSKKSKELSKQYDKEKYYSKILKIYTKIVKGGK